MSVINNKESFGSFYYDELVKLWANTFGMENIKILFFEDFLTDQIFFVKELASILKIDEKIILTLLKDKHFNKKDKIESDSYIRYIERPFLVQAFIKALKFLINSNLKDKIKDIIGKNFVKRIRYKKSVIRGLTKEEKDMIFNEFKPSNERLWKEFDVDKDKLKKYNYI